VASIVLDGLSKAFRGPRGEEVHAVRDLSLSIGDGELVVLVGPSGCGKSTTLRMIAGLEDPTAGTIAIGGRVVNGLEPKDRDVAMVFQSYALYPHMTVAENMAFGLRLRKVPRDEIRRRIGEVAAALALDGLLDRKPAALSGGQRQRVALGRAIVRRPRAFLFDEPLSNLDARLRAQMRVELAKLHRGLGATMVYVTHDQVEAMTLGDRIAVLKDGEAQQVADPGTLYDRPANLFVAGFIGSPPMNFFEGSLERDGAILVFRERADVGGFRVPVGSGAAGALSDRAGRPVVLGLRPEAIGDPREAAGGPAGSSVRARVEVVEHLGPETHLHLTTGSHAFTARVGAGSGARPGEPIDLAFSLERARFFDPETGKAI